MLIGARFLIFSILSLVLSSAKSSPLIMDHPEAAPKYLFRPITEDRELYGPVPVSAAAASVVGMIPASGIPVSVQSVITTASCGAHGIQRMTMSPTRPKLYSCWRRSEEAWSSTGSRHSSRPGSSTASSSRPPSQPGCSNNIQGGASCSNNAMTNSANSSGGGPTGSSGSTSTTGLVGGHIINPGSNAGSVSGGSVNITAGLYCKSNNSSLSDVSVARNFQQLSVSSRRALFKTQKWSNSFDQPSLAQSQMSSPGRRRHHNATNQRENKSLDLDSGYSGSSGSWTGGGGGGGSGNQKCCSPLESVKRELEQLKDQTELLNSLSSSGPWIDPISGSQSGTGSQSNNLQILESNESTSSCNAAAGPFLPSFPESFVVNTVANHPSAVTNPAASSSIVSDSEIVLVNLDETAPEEALDCDLDEEIKMIVARAERRNNSNGSDGLLTFLEEHGLDPALDPGSGGGAALEHHHLSQHHHNHPNSDIRTRYPDIPDVAADDQDLDLLDGEDQPHLLFVRPEPVKTRNPLLCQKSSSSSGYETCISSVSDTVPSSMTDSTSGGNGNNSTSGAAASNFPVAPPRTKRGASKSTATKSITKSPTSHLKPPGRIYL